MKKAYFAIALLVAALTVLSAVQPAGQQVAIQNSTALAILAAGFGIASMMEHDDDMETSKKKRK